MGTVAHWEATRPRLPGPGAVCPAACRPSRPNRRRTRRSPTTPAGRVVPDAWMATPGVTAGAGENFSTSSRRGLEIAALPLCSRGIDPRPRRPRLTPTRRNPIRKTTKSQISPSDRTPWAQDYLRQSGRNSQQSRLLPVVPLCRKSAKVSYAGISVDHIRSEYLPGRRMRTSATRRN